MRIVVVFVVVGSLLTVAMCDDPWKTATAPPQPDGDDSPVENNVFCDSVVDTDTIHVPVFSDHHHRLLQLHLRTNIQVIRTALTCL